MPRTFPDAALIEIVEKRKTDTGESGAAGILVPNEVRINGIPLLCPQQEFIVLRDLTIGGQEAVQITLTLFARRVEIKSEVSE